MTTEENNKNSENKNNGWWLFYGDGEEHPVNIEDLPVSPPWRKFKVIKKPKSEEDEKSPELIELETRWGKIKKLADSEQNRQGKDQGRKFRILTPTINKEGVDGDNKKDTSGEELLVNVVDAVNAAIYLRRPLLVTGNPGSGKTSLAYAIAYELKLGPVLTWPITARSNLRDGLYRYDAIARLQDSQLHQGDPEYIEDIGEYITLGSVGTAFMPSLYPRVLLIDEIDKSDINLPNDLLHLFEEGKFEIPELVRWTDKAKKVGNAELKSVEVRTEDAGVKAPIKEGRIHCSSFPIVIMTSNGERDFPPAFVRRCLRVRMPDPNEKALQAIINAHFDSQSESDKLKKKIGTLIEEFLEKDKQDRATDQLLNAIYIRNNLSAEAFTENLQDLLLKSLQTQDNE